MNAFEKLMKLSDFNTVYTEEYDEVKPFMHVDVLIDENDALNEENYTHFDENDTHFNEDETNEAIEPQVNIFLNRFYFLKHIYFNHSFFLCLQKGTKDKEKISKNEKRSSQEKSSQTTTSHRSNQALSMPRLL